MSKLSSDFTYDKYQKQFAEVFESACGKYHPWEVWSDFLSASSAELSIVKQGWQKAEYEQALARVGMDKLSRMLIIMVDSLDHNQNQDFLGEIYMRLDMGDHGKGQFFTPASVARLNAAIVGAETYTCKEAMQKRREELMNQLCHNGYLAVSDPTCGSGAGLIAVHDQLMRMEIPQMAVFYYGQDLSQISAKMCHIQLSLLGVPGMVTIGDTLTHPGPSAEGNINLYTPACFFDEWQDRLRHIRMLNALKWVESHKPEPTGVSLFADIQSEQDILQENEHGQMGLF